MKQQSRRSEFQRNIDNLVHTFGQTEGEAGASIHRDVMSYAAQRFNGDDITSDLPENLVSYLDKVAVYAYKVIDADVHNLQAAEYSDDAIFEVTIGGSLGPGLATWQAGMEAIDAFFDGDKPSVDGKVE